MKALVPQTLRLEQVKDVESTDAAADSSKLQEPNAHCKHLIKRQQWQICEQVYL